MTVVCYLQELYPVEGIFTLLLISSVGNNKLVFLLILITYFYMIKPIIDTRTSSKVHFIVITSTLSL